MREPEDNSPLEEIRTQVKRLLSRKGKRLERQLLEWQAQLNKAKAWEEWFHQGKLLQSRFFEIKKGMTVLSVPDWNREMELRTISLDPSKDAQENLSHYFKTAKKLQKAIPHLEKHLENKVAEIEQLQITQQLAETTTDSAFLEQWLPIPQKMREKSLLKEKEKSLPYKEFTSKTGISIYVGKNGRANDKLTFQIANGNDWWLHAAGIPGSHIVIRHENPDRETIEEAMALAVEYSKAKKSGEAEVVVTQRKYVSKVPRGNPGQVQISQHKTYLKKIR